ncbi:MAG: hypothetical protein WC505_00255 [Patescibacteria group bacterium]
MRGGHGCRAGHISSGHAKLGTQLINEASDFSVTAERAAGSAYQTLPERMFGKFPFRSGTSIQKTPDKILVRVDEMTHDITWQAVRNTFRGLIIAKIFRYAY